MSAAVAEPLSAPPAGLSPLEYVRALSPEEKEAVFFALLAEAREQGEADGTLVLENLTGETVGYFVSPGVLN